MTDIHPAIGSRPYLPKLYHQIDGSTFQQSNCVLATSTMLMDRASVGYWRVPASTLRKLSGDTSGGVTYDVAAAATKAGTSGAVILQPSYGHTPAEMKAIVAGGHAVGVSILGSVTLNTPYHTGNVTGGHTVYANQWRYNATLARDEYLMGDVGRGTATNDTGYVWWPAWLVYKAAEARGGGFINLLVARDTEGVTRTAGSAGTVWFGASRVTTQVATFTAGKSFVVAFTQVGASWTIGTHSGAGWHRVANGYIVGGRLR